MPRLPSLTPIFNGSACFSWPDNQYYNTQYKNCQLTLTSGLDYFGCWGFLPKKLSKNLPDEGSHLFTFSLLASFAFIKAGFWLAFFN